MKPGVAGACPFHTQWPRVHIRSQTEPCDPGQSPPPLWAPHPLYPGGEESHTDPAGPCSCGAAVIAVVFALAQGGARGYLLGVGAVCGGREGRGPVWCLPRVTCSTQGQPAHGGGSGCVAVRSGGLRVPAVALDWLHFPCDPRRVPHRPWEADSSCEKGVWIRAPLGALLALSPPSWLWLMLLSPAPTVRSD